MSQTSEAKEDSGRVANSLALFFLAAAIQLFPSLRSGGDWWHPDESFSVATLVHVIKTGEVPVFKLGQTYMFPAEELADVPVTFLTDSAWGIRASTVFFWSLGCVFLYLCLNREYSTVVSWAVVLPFAVTHPSLQTYGAFAIGEYSVGFFLLNLFWYIAQPAMRKNNIAVILGLGILAGLGVVVFRLLILPAMAWLLIFIRQRFKEAPENPFKLRTILPLVCELVFAGTCLLPTLYRYLTRTGTGTFTERIVSNYSPKSYEYVLWGLALCGLLLAAITAFRLRHLVSRRLAAGIAVFVVPLAAAVVVPSLIFRAALRQNYPADDPPVFWNVAYSWKHWHEWWGNFCTLLGSVFPHLTLENPVLSIQDFTNSWNV